MQDFRIGNEFSTESMRAPETKISDHEPPSKYFHLSSQIPSLPYLPCSIYNMVSMPQRSDGLDLRSACGRWMKQSRVVKRGCLENPLLTKALMGKSSMNWVCPIAMIDYLTVIMMHTSSERLTLQACRLEICTHVFHCIVTSHKAEKFACSK